MVTIEAHGHKNILANHKTTLEVTTSPDLTLNGDCIIAVGAKYDIEDLKALASGTRTLEVTIEVGDDSLRFIAQTNPDFTDPKEIVFRRGEFASERTLGVRASMACVDLPRDFVAKLRNPNQKILIHIEPGE